jgi:hypothetical protein
MPAQQILHAAIVAAAVLMSLRVVFQLAVVHGLATRSDGFKTTWKFHAQLTLTALAIAAAVTL